MADSRFRLGFVFISKGTWQGGVAATGIPGLPKRARHFAMETMAQHRSIVCHMHSDNLYSGSWSCVSDFEGRQRFAYAWTMLQ